MGYGRAGDGPSGLALLSAQAEKGPCRPMCHARPVLPALPAQLPRRSLRSQSLFARGGRGRLHHAAAAFARAVARAVRGYPVAGQWCLVTPGAPLYWRDVPTHAGAAAKGQPAAEPLRVLVVGAMHGDELTAASLALRWIGMAAAEGAVDADEPAPVHWRFIPVLNPDGLLAPNPRA